jgi:hypothetical protein
VLRRYWLRFAITKADFNNPTRRWNPLLAGGVGVSAWDLDDALVIVRDWLFGGEELPPLTEIFVDVNVSTLWEEGAFFRGGFLGVPVWRGVWYPGDNLHLPGRWPRGPRRPLDRPS